LQSGLVLGIEPMLTCVQAGDLGLQRGKRSGRSLGSFGSLALRCGQSTDFGRRRLTPATQRIDLAGKPGQPFPPIGRRADQSSQPIFLTSMGVLAGSSMGGRLFQCLGSLPQLVRQLMLLGCDPRSLALQLVRIPDKQQLARIVLDLPHPLSRDRERAGDPLFERRKRIPRLLRSRQSRYAFAYGRFGGHLRRPRNLECPLEGFAAYLHRLFVGELGLQCLGCLKQIISQQSRLRVT
jgi:hypothetical protein